MPTQLKGLAGSIVPMACHVGKLEDLERLVDSTREFGNIDILVNNAGTNIAQGPGSRWPTPSSTRWWTSTSRAPTA